MIDREVRLEVPERMDADGKVLTPLDEAAVAEAAKALLAAGCEAVVIHFLHSYINPAHERRAAEIVRGLWPNAYVTAGHVILSEYREYERGVTAAVNASVQPVPRPLPVAAAHGAEGQGLRPRPAGDAGQWRHHLVAADRRGGGEHRDVRPGLGRDGGGLYRPRLGPSQPDHLRHGRHLDRCRPDRERRAAGLGRARTRICHADPRADGRRAHDRRRRRLDRLGRCGGHAAGRPGERGRTARARSATAAAAPSPPSPTPTWCWAGSIPTSSWASTIR